MISRRGYLECRVTELESSKYLRISENKGQRCIFEEKLFEEKSFLSQSGYIATEEEETTRQRSVKITGATHSQLFPSHLVESTQGSSVLVGHSKLSRVKTDALNVCNRVNQMRE